MKRNLNTALLAAILLLGLAACAGKQIPAMVVPEAEPVKTTSTEGSLWPGQNGPNMLFADNKALRVGDIVTVYLVESVKALNSTTNHNSSQTKNSLTMSPIDVNPALNVSVSGGEDFRGSGSSSRNDALTATLSAMVTEVLTNGNMKIEGRRKMKINNEDQYIHITGIVRQEDINFDNSIMSTKIANSEIQYDGVGDLNDTNNGGWGTWLFQKIWPF